MTDQATEETVKPDTESSAAPTKPRGACTGCRFDYRLGTARTGEHKGKLVVRKHNARTGPGLCSGAGAPPREPETDGLTLEALADAGIAGDKHPSAVPTIVVSDDPASVEPQGVNGTLVIPTDAFTAPAPHSMTNGIDEEPTPENVMELIQSGPLTGAPRLTDPAWNPPGNATAELVDAFTAPAPASVIPDGSVSMQPEPDREPETENVYPVSHDRTTTGDSGDQGVQPAEVHPGDGVSGVDGVAEQGLRTDHGVRAPGESTPADVPVVGGGDPGGSVDRSPVQEHQVRGPGSPGSGDAVGEHASSAGSVGAPQRQEDALSAGAPVRRGEHAVRIPGGGSDMSDLPGQGQPGVPGPAQGDAFMSPGAATVIPDSSVSMQPAPDRDRWQRYLLPGPDGKQSPHTRATTFAKAASSTFTLNQWQQRMTIAGLVMRPDLVALAHGLDVKADRAQLNSIAEQAKEAAGQKVAANLGTAYHAFSERLDASLIQLADVPEQYRPRLAQFQETVRGAGLTTRTEWIERSTAVRADQVSAAIPVAGTLDRIYQLPSGELVIGDLKTGADLSYGWGEIAVQLALYAHGVNTFGLFDWRRKEWEQVNNDLLPGRNPVKVRTDFAIVVHLPAGGDGCTLHKVDLVKGWARAQVCGQVMAMQADKGALSHPFTPEPHAYGFPTQPVPTAPVAVPQDPAWEHAKGVFRTATDQAHLAQLYQYAMDSGKFHTDQLATLVGIGKDRLAQLAK